MTVHGTLDMCQISADFIQRHGAQYLSPCSKNTGAQQGVGSDVKLVRLKHEEIKPGTKYFQESGKQRSHQALGI